MTTQQTYEWSGSMHGLPDPDRDAQFYDGVRSRRLAAWFFDVALILLLGIPVAIVFGLATFGLGFATVLTMVVVPVLYATIFRVH